MVKVRKDLTGQKFGKLTVVRQAEDYVNPNTGKPTSRWFCKCDCGGTLEVVGASLTGNVTRSCGCIVSPDRAGEESCTKYGTKAILVKYIDSRNVIVEFDDDYHYQCQTKYENFVKGHIENPYDKTIYGTGCFGVGQHTSKEYAYYVWHNILERCYNTNRKKSDDAYIDCEVYKDWLIYQNFAEWYSDNSYDCFEKLTIDKDFIGGESKLYSPKTCILIPKSLNLALVNSTRCKSRKGNNVGLPMGVERHGSIYTARLSMGCNHTFIGNYVTIEEAEQAYRKSKGNYLLSLTETYAKVMPDSLYAKISNRIKNIYDIKGE